MDVKSSQGPFAHLPPILQQMHEAKATKNISFEEIAKKLGKGEIYVASIFYGQAKPSPDDLEALSQVLGMEHSALTGSMGEHWWPYRAMGGGIPTDPLIYRLYEGVLVYGHPIKAVIHEKFGDGIMSMIDCKVNIERKKDPKGDRVLLTFDGKFLPYATW